MEEMEETQQGVRVGRAVSAGGDKEIVSIEKTKTVRRTIERPRRSGKTGASRAAPAVRWVLRDGHVAHTAWAWLPTLLMGPATPHADVQQIAEEVADTQTSGIPPTSRE
jgi:hypothetical protein